MKHNLPKQVILLGWVSFFADVSSEMIYPLIPLYLVSILGSSTLALGLIEGIAQSIVSIISAYSGITSDRSRKRVSFVRWGYGLPILGKALMSVAVSWHFVLLGRSVDRFGKGLRGSPRDALIADAIDGDRRGEAFGFHRMMDTAGAVVGVGIAGAFLWFLEGGNLEVAYRIIFGLAALMAVCSLLVTFFIDEGRTGSSADLTRREKAPANQSLYVSICGLGRAYWINLSIFAIFAFANSSDAFLLLRASVAGLSAFQVVLIYVLYNLSYALCSYPAGKLSDHHGRWRVISIGWTIYAFVYAGIAIGGGYLIWILFAFYGAYMALTEGVGKALMVDCVPAEKRGTALGILYLALGLSALSSNMLAGYLWEHVGMNSPFWIGSLTATVAILTVFLSGRSRV